MSTEEAGWAIERLSRGYVETGTLFTAATLGIADILAGGPMPVSAIAKASGNDAQMLQRLLDFLVSRGVFKRVSSDSVDPESVDASYGNSTASELLRAGAPNSMRDLALLPKWDMPPWLSMPDAMKQGEKATAFELWHNQTFWEYLGDRPKDTETFSGAMNNYAQIRKGVLRRMDSNVAAAEGDVVVDVGGANGAMLAFVLEELRPHARGIVFDLPFVIRGATASLLFDVA
jgi:hypothetical protein